MDDLTALPLTLYKRWTLRRGVTHEDVRRLVRERIQPAYRRLSGDVELGLELDMDGRSIVAVQRWASGTSHQAATTGAAHERWWAEYEPELDDWDLLVEFDDEWSTYELDLRDHR